MSDRFFKELLGHLLSEAEAQRDQCRLFEQSVEQDKWSAVAGHLDNARKRMRK